VLAPRSGNYTLLSRQNGFVPKFQVPPPSHESVFRKISEKKIFQLPPRTQ